MVYSVDLYVKFKYLRLFVYTITNPWENIISVNGSSTISLISKKKGRNNIFFKYTVFIRLN